MERHFLGRIYDYYFEHGKNRLDVEAVRKAGTLFFDEHTKHLFGSDAHFNEWLMFEYPLHTPRTKRYETLLARWVHENPCNVGSTTMKRYQELALHNHYGWFEVKEVCVDSHIVLKALEDGTVYKVREREATHGLTVGMFMVSRIGLIDDQYEIVSASIDALPSLRKKDVARIRSIISAPWSVRDTYQFILHPRGTDDELLLDTGCDSNDSIVDAITLFARFQLDTLVSVEQVQNWIRSIFSLIEQGASQEALDEAFSTPANILMGLAYGRIYSDGDDLDAVFDMYVDLVMVEWMLWQKKRTPYQKSKGTMCEPEKHIKVDGIIFEWTEKAETAVRMIKQHKYTLARQMYDSVFEHLLTHRTAIGDVYRIFLNAGIAYFLDGESALGKRIVEYAQMLNPKYTLPNVQLEAFAKTTTRYMEDPELKSIVSILKRSCKSKRGDAVRDKLGMSVSEKYLQDKLANCPAHLYYVWLMQWGINFEKDELETPVQNSKQSKKKRDNK